MTTEYQQRTLRLYRAWRRAAEAGYGKTTTQSDAMRIDANIARLKALYEAHLAAPSFTTTPAAIVQEHLDEVTALESQAIAAVARRIGQ